MKYKSRHVDIWLHEEYAYASVVACQRRVTTNAMRQQQSVDMRSGERIDTADSERAAVAQRYRFDSIHSGVR